MTNASSYNLFQPTSIFPLLSFPQSISNIKCIFNFPVGANLLAAPQPFLSFFTDDSAPPEREEILFFFSLAVCFIGIPGEIVFREGAKINFIKKRRRGAF